MFSLKVIVSFFSYNTQRSNVEELLQISRDKVASGFTDEIQGTSCLQNKLLQLQVSIHLLKTYLVPKLSFSHVEPSPLCVMCITKGKGASLQPDLLEVEGKSRV